MTKQEEKELFKKVKKFVKDSFTQAGKQDSVKHFMRTAFWIKKLKPDADEALLISGIAHDIERAFHGDWVKGSTNKKILRKHQDMCAEEIGKFLKQKKVDDNFIKRIMMLISHHEDGGSKDQNILKDADSISYFENQSLRHIYLMSKQGKPKKEIRKKFDYTFNRISICKAKQIAKPFYEKAIKELEQQK